MNMKSIALSLACAAGVAGSAYSAVLENVGTDVIPGEWTKSFQTAKDYAEANGVPLLMFWSNNGCGQCNKMKLACNNSDFVEWRKTRKLIFVFSENDPASKPFAANSSKKFPYMRLYWPAGNVDQKFTGRASTIPAGGSTLQAQLMNYVDSQIKAWINGGGDPGSGISGGGSTPAPAPTPSVPTPGPEWNRSRTLYGSYYSSNGAVAGRIMLKVGKKTAKGTAKIKATVKDINGKKRNSTTATVTVDATTKGSLSGAFGSYSFSISGNSISGTISISGATYNVKPISTGGTISDGTLTFSLLDYPKNCQGYPVIEPEKYLPLAQKFTVRSSRWTFPRKGTLKFDSNTGAFTMSSLENPSGLKLAYSSADGYVKGSFTVYAKSSERLAKRYTANVSGFMVGGNGAGIVTIKNVGTYSYSIKDAATIAAEAEAAK